MNTCIHAHMHYADNDMLIRVCRAQDRRRTMAVWTLYYDASKRFPNTGWLPLETPTPPPFEIRTFKNKGRGMVASRDIKVGEVLLNERPILLMPHQMPVFHPSDTWKDFEGPLLRMLYLLEQEDREKVLQLHNCKSLENYGPLGGILMTNSVSFPVPGSSVCGRYAAICLTISYVNRACSPNALYEYDTDTVVFSVRATRNIAKGEEITFRHVHDEGMLTAERQAVLRKKYSFKCACKLCSASAASDERWKFINATLPSVHPMIGGWNDLGLNRGERTSERRRIEKTFEALIRAMEEEGLYTSHTDCIYFCMGKSAVLGDMKAYKKWAKKALEAERRKGNQMSQERIDKSEKYLKDPTSDPMSDLLAVKLAERIKTIYL